MLNFDAAGAAQTLLPVCGDCLLVEMDFSSGVQRANNTGVDITALSVVWTRAGGNLMVDGLEQSESNGTNRLSVKIGIADSATFTKAIGPASVYRGRSVKVYLQLLDEFHQPVGAPRLFWTGQMEHMSIDRTDTGGGTIIMSCSKPGMSRSRRSEGLRISHAQRLAAHPGDKSYQYITDLINKPVVWLSKRFQRAVA